jgi:hypothetical protein
MAYQVDAVAHPRRRRVPARDGPAHARGLYEATDRTKADELVAAVLEADGLQPPRAILRRAVRAIREKEPTPTGSPSTASATRTIPISWRRPGISPSRAVTTRSRSGSSAADRGRPELGHAYNQLGYPRCVRGAAEAESTTSYCFIALTRPTPRLPARCTDPGRLPEAVESSETALETSRISGTCTTTRVSRVLPRTCRRGGGCGRAGRPELPVSCPRP